MKRGNIVENYRNNTIMQKMLKGFLSKGTVQNHFMLNVHADEGDEPSNGGDPAGGSEPPKQTAPTINYEDLISKARAEEKAKQYKKIEKLENQIDTLTKQHNDDLLKIGQLERDLETAEKKLQTSGQGDSEEIKTLKSEVESLKKEKSKLDKKIEEFEKNTVSREELETEIRTELEAEYTTKTYRAEKMAELKDDILVPELVMGNTVEEIDASIEVALAKSKEIREKLGVTDGSTQSPQHGRTPKSPSNPSVSGVQNAQFSEDYIASLDVRSPEYAEFRKQMGLH